MDHHGRRGSGGGWERRPGGHGRGRHHGLAGRSHPQDLVLARLGLDEQVAGLAGGNALARLKGLQGGEGHGDLGAGLPRPQSRLVDHNLLDGGRAVLLGVWRLEQRKKNAIKARVGNIFLE